MDQAASSWPSQPSFRQPYLFCKNRVPPISVNAQYFYKCVFKETRKEGSDRYAVSRIKTKHGPSKMNEQKYSIKSNREEERKMIGSALNHYAFAVSSCLSTSCTRRTRSFRFCRISSTPSVSTPSSFKMICCMTDSDSFLCSSSRFLASLGGESI